MSEILNINQGVNYNNSVIKYDYHTYSPFLNSFENSDEIRICVQQQDLYVLPCESFIYIEAGLTKKDGSTALTGVTLTNNAIAFLFNEIRYELNGVEIDQSRNVGLTSTLKNYISLNKNESDALYNAAWSPGKAITPIRGLINFCIPLKLLLGFAEDYKKIIVNAKHELIMIRSGTNSNAFLATTEDDDIKLSIFKLQWRLPQETVADAEKLKLLELINIGRPIEISFRRWEIHEYPVLPKSNQHIWTIKTSNQLEKPRYVILALQTKRDNKITADASKFDHCNITDVKVHLNSEIFPYNDLNVKFSTERYALLYEMYSKFQKSYYGRQCLPLLSRDEFKEIAPIAVIDCSHQNDSIKSGPVDIKLEFKTEINIPDETAAYCLLLHDRVIEYNPLTTEVRKMV